MINKNIYVEDLVSDYPEVISPLAQYGIVCIACGEPVWGTLEELMAGKDLKNQDEIIQQLNKIIEGKNDGKE